MDQSDTVEIKNENDQEKVDLKLGIEEKLEPEFLLSSVSLTKLAAFLSSLC